MAVNLRASALLVGIALETVRVARGEPPLVEGSGGGGKGDGRIGLAPGAWPDAAVSIASLVVTPPDATEATRAEIEPLLVTPPVAPPVTSRTAPRSREDAEYDELFERHFPNPYAWDHFVASRRDVVATDSHPKGQIAACYREALTARATVTGRVALRLRFDTECDCIHPVKVARNTTGDSTLARCVADSLSGLRIPDGAPDPVEARVTLLFHRKK
ncbi:MAG TPA: hypothetical protein VN903_14645 [Polyangia bacterium]|jgi:hypothetical protein|nr:hypothetical protein [Polyangia bacterium]